MSRRTDNPTVRGTAAASSSKHLGSGGVAVVGDPAAIPIPANFDQVEAIRTKNLRDRFSECKAMTIIDQEKYSRGWVFSFRMTEPSTATAFLSSMATIPGFHFKLQEQGGRAYLKFAHLIDTTDQISAASSHKSFKVIILSLLLIILFVLYETL